jgi:beta-glucosidase
VISADGKLTITVSVTNSGDRKGKEVAQLYIGDDKASVVRPLKELKHFKKIELQPGETQNVTFEVTADDLKFYDESIAGWTAEPGKFRAYIGSSSTDIRAVVPFSLK